MASVTLSIAELRELIGKPLEREKILNDLFELGMDVEDVQGDNVTLEITPDRADLLCIEGIARLLRSYYEIQPGLAIPRVRKSSYILHVERELENIRPYITGAIVKNLALDDKAIRSLMQVQEKLHATLGRKRKKGAIGVHDLDKISGRNIYYRAIDPESERFIPLQKNMPMSPREILEKHEKGREYGYILEGKSKVPVIYDEKELFSFPPIINARKTEVTEQTKAVLIEMTGEDQRTIDLMLNILLYMLEFRGGKIYSVKVRYHDRELIRPALGVKQMVVEVNYINKVLGLNLTQLEIKRLLERMGFGASVVRNALRVKIPPYRTDILHRIDIVDDVGRAYGFNRIEPRYPPTLSIGNLTEQTKLSDAAREVLIGLGFQDTLNFILIGKEECYTKMNLDPSLDERIVEIENPYSEQYTIMRSWLIPSLMIVLSHNTHRPYPQNICEIGIAAQLDENEETGVREEERIAALLCSSDAGYNEIKAKLQALLYSFGFTLDQIKTEPVEHPSFISGRAAQVILNGKAIGIIGEIHPQVLKNFKLEMPVAAFEIKLEALKS
ncbi:MAG: phenylalanine--tRNA ligase subunit beta [Methanocellales archaeon]